MGNQGLYDSMTKDDYYEPRKTSSIGLESSRRAYEKRKRNFHNSSHEYSEPIDYSRQIYGKRGHFVYDPNKKEKKLEIPEEFILMKVELDKKFNEDKIDKHLEGSEKYYLMMKNCESKKAFIRQNMARVKDFPPLMQNLFVKLCENEIRQVNERIQEIEEMENRESRKKKLFSKSDESIRMIKLKKNLNEKYSVLEVDRNLKGRRRYYEMRKNLDLRSDFINSSLEKYTKYSRTDSEVNKMVKYLQKEKKELERTLETIADMEKNDPLIVNSNVIRHVPENRFEIPKYVKVKEFDFSKVNSSHQFEEVLFALKKKEDLIKKLKENTLKTSDYAYTEQKDRKKLLDECEKCLHVIRKQRLAINSVDLYNNRNEESSSDFSDTEEITITEEPKIVEHKPKVVEPKEDYNALLEKIRRLEMENLKLKSKGKQKSHSKGEDVPDYEHVQYMQQHTDNEEFDGEKESVPVLDSEYIGGIYDNPYDYS